MTTPSDLLTRELRRDGARPFITWYDPRTGGRIELSVTTTANWVAKTAGYLGDEIGLGPGDEVTVGTEPHWISAVLLLAAWAVGVATAFFTDWTSGSMAQVLTFALVVVFLQVRPQGLFSVRTRSLA